MKSIAIDISKNGISIVEVSADRNFFEILSGDFIPLNPNDESNWEMDLLQTLKSLSGQYDFKNQEVVVGLSQSLLSTRNLQFPFTRRLDIMKSLPFEMDEELPLGSDEAVIDAKIIAQNPSQTSLLAFAAPKSHVQKWIELFESVDIVPDILSAEGAGFANLFENWANGSFLASSPETIPSPLTLRVLFRHDTTLLAAFHDRQMIWTRNISWGEKNIAMEIMKNYNYPYEQAAELIPNQLSFLMNPTEGSTEEQQLHLTLESAFAEFIHYLNLSMIDLKDKFSSHVGQIYLMGGVGQIGNVTAILTKYTGIPMNAETLSDNVLQPRQVTRVAHVAEKLPVAVGLALEAFKRPRNPAINFRQGEFAKNSQFWAETWSKWGYAMTLAAVAYVIFIVYGVVREEVSMQLDTAGQEALEKTAGAVANLRGREASPGRVADYLKTESEKVKNAKVFEKVKDIEPAMKVVGTLSTLLPDNKNNGYDIRRVDVKSNSMIIEGEAQKQLTVDLIRKKLETLSADKRIQVVPATIRAKNGVAFAFKINIKETL